MAKQQTKKERLVNLYHQARMDLPNDLFMNFLCFAWGVFEAAIGFQRQLKHGDISIIEKELKNLRNEAEYLKELLEIDKQVDQESLMAKETQNG